MTCSKMECSLYSVRVSGLIALKIIFQVHYDSFFAWSRPLQNGKRHAAIHPISPTAKKDRPRAVFFAYSFFLPIDDPRCFKQYIGSLGQICIVGELLRTVGDPAVVARDENQPGIPDASAGTSYHAPPPN